VHERHEEWVRRTDPNPPAREERTVAAPPAESGPTARIVQAVDYLFYLLYGLLAVRLVLAMLGAREGTAFVQLIHGLTGPFYAPFEGIVTRPDLNGGYMDFPAVIAILAYVVLHVAVRGLIGVIVGRRIG
jgi:uncharacterized protein YggT (Ycf19 family)